MRASRTSRRLTGARPAGRFYPIPASTCLPLIYVVRICRIEVYGDMAAGPRIEERQRRAARPVARRGPRPARLRHRQDDRGALEGDADLQGRVAVSAALPPRTAWMDQGRL